MRLRSAFVSFEDLTRRQISAPNNRPLHSIFAAPTIGRPLIKYGYSYYAKLPHPAIMCYRSA